MSSRDDDVLGQLLLRQDNVISRRQALRLLGPGAVRHRLATGRWQVAHRGVYFAGSEPFVFANASVNGWLPSARAAAARLRSAE